MLVNIVVPVLDLFTLCPSAGHSRSIVGLEQRKNGSLCLLLLDPGSSVSDTRKLLNRDTVSTAVRHVRKFPGSLKHKQYQLVVVQGLLSAEDKQVCVCGLLWFRMSLIFVDCSRLNSILSGIAGYISSQRPVLFID